MPSNCIEGKPAPSAQEDLLDLLARDKLLHQEKVFQERSDMAGPRGFTWVEKPTLAAMAQPSSPDEMQWLREQGLQMVLSLTEERLPRDWGEDAGLLVFHEPLEDMEAPTQEQLDRCVSAIAKALAANLPVVVHCGAGLGAHRRRPRRLPRQQRHRASHAISASASNAAQFNRNRRTGRIGRTLRSPSPGRR